MLAFTFFVAVHVAVSFTAARWWMRPTLLGFDKKYDLPPCKESDFYFFCFMWSVVLLMIGSFAVWKALLSKVLHPAYRAVLPADIRVHHAAEDTGDPPTSSIVKK